MKFDQLDKFIILELYKSKKNDKETTTWDIAKNFFNQSEKAYHIESLDSRKIGIKCTNIKKRLDLMLKEKYAIKYKNGEKKWAYLLNGDFIKISKHRFDDGMKNVLLIRI